MPTIQDLLREASINKELPAEIEKIPAPAENPPPKVLPPRKQSQKDWVGPSVIDMGGGVKRVVSAKAEAKGKAKAK